VEIGPALLYAARSCIFVSACLQRAQ